MITVEIFLMQRQMLDDEFTEIWSETAYIGAKTVRVEPVVPAELAGRELAVRVLADGMVSFQIQTPAHIPDDELAPAELSFVPASPICGAWANRPAQIRFVRGTVALSGAGRPL